MRPGITPGRSRTGWSSGATGAAVADPAPRRSGGGVMGRFLDGFGDDAYDHEGYAAQVLNDGTLTSTYSDDTEPRMIGQVVPACGCGWTGTTRYPTTGPFDETAKELALGEWEREHARPVLDGQRVGIWEHLRTGVRQLAESHAAVTRARFSD